MRQSYSIAVLCSDDFSLWLVSIIFATAYTTVAMDKNSSPQIHKQHTSSSPGVVSLAEIRRSIALTNAQLLQLIHHDDKLHHTIKSINLQGIKNIQLGHHTHALLYFSECERILEYAASCGKTIDRSLIIAILNNQALLYHKTNDIDTAYNYLEAILYNLKQFVDAPQNILIQSSLQKLATESTATPQSQTFIEQNFEEIKSLFERRQQLSIFYLRFSGLNSQRQMHAQSLHNARQALKYMKQLCKMCYHYHRIISPNNPHIKMLMQQLSSIDDDLTDDDLSSLREQLQQLCGGLVDNNHIFHQSYQNLSPQNKEAVMQTDVHTLFDLEPIYISDNILEDQNLNIELCSSYFMQVNKVLYIMGAYFAIAVETQEIQCPQDSQTQKSEENQEESTTAKGNPTVQIAYLYSLIIGYKYLPKNVKLTNYLYSLYCESYPSALAHSQESRIMSVIFTPTSKMMQQNLNQLKQKYKNYIVEREMDLSDSASHQQERKLKDSSSIIGNWQQEKKESKKLTQLLKQDTTNSFLSPSQYLNDVQYIDSFQMANSQSATQNSVSMEMKNISSDDIHRTQTKKEKKEVKFKQVAHYQSTMFKKPQKLSTLLLAKFSANPNRIPYDSNPSKKSKGREVSKSRSVKNIKSKSKQPKSKPSSKKNISIYTISSAGVMHSVNTISRKLLSKSKSSSKNKYEGITTNASDHKKGLRTDKKAGIMGSERIKYSHNINPLASVKNSQSIKFNKVKSPTLFQQRNTKLTSVYNQKHQKRQSKNSASYKKVSSKSLSLAKSQNKHLNSTSNLKIYTSVGWAKSKKH